MKVSNFTMMPFCENWKITIARRPPEARLRFLDVYFAAAFDGWTPSEGDPNEVIDDYMMIAPIIAERVRKAAAGRAGGRPKKTKTDAQENTSAFPSAFPSAFQGAFQGFPSALKHPESTFSDSFKKKRIEENRKEGSEQARALSPAFSDTTSAFPSASSDEHLEAPQPTADDDPTPSVPPKNAPSLDDVRAAARKLNIPDDFAEYFQAEMDKLDWKAMKPSGAVYPVTRLNVAQTLRNWWHKNEEQKKERAAREAEATAAAVPMNGAGRAAVEAWTGGAEE